MLQISNTVIIPAHEIELSAIRSQGAGGQNVNIVEEMPQRVVDEEAVI